MINKGEINRAIKQKNLFTKAFILCLMKMGFSNEEIRVLQVRNRYYHKLKRKYNKYLYEQNNHNSRKEKPESGKIIWFFWYDGLDKAPKLVKLCYKQLKMYKPKDYKIVFLDKNNMLEYADIPKYVLKKMYDEKMTMTHFSDILRLALLVKYGGIWMDSTVYLTGNISDLIMKSDFFVFSNEYRNDETINFDSWFIKAKSGNLLLEKTLDLLYVYWKLENSLSEYFLCHMFFKMVTEKYPNEWRKTTKVTTLLPHHLQKIMYNEYFEQEWIQVCNECSIHKLTYKLKKEKVKNNSYINKILREEIK